MPSQRSGGACLRCKDRHLKCDETQPRCQRCASSDIQCPGYDTGLKFLDQGAGLRRKFNHDETTSRSGSGSKRTKGSLAQFTDSINEPRRVLRFIDDSTDPSANDEDDIGVPESHNSSPVQISRTVLGPSHDVGGNISSRDSQEDQKCPMQRDSYFHSPYSTNNATSNTSVLQSPYGTTESLSKSVDSVYYTARKPSKVYPTLPGSIQEEAEIENNFQILFLIRHFSEIVGPWMDLYDLGNYFASYIPIIAHNSPLTRYSACAIAAKQLGRVKGQKAIMGGVCSQQASTEILQDCEKMNWFYIAAKYYDRAIGCLREALVKDPSQRSADELLAATSILSVYEFMDDSNTEWSRHLSGVKSLLDEANVMVMPTGGKPSRAQVAAFWNFARCDYLAAYINHTKTRLDTEDLPLWRSAGLFLDDESLLTPQSSSHTKNPYVEDEMRVDMISNALVWLLSKLMNYLVSCADTQGSNSASWKRLDYELENWFNNLPESFTPSGTLHPDPKSSDLSRRTFSEMFYSIPLCAVTVQHYHFARIILLLHKPRGVLPSVREQLQEVREIPEKIKYHSREICGIALGRPPGYVRIHMLQPLFMSGQCLEKVEERKIILDILRGIELDLGWATECRVKELLADWGWSPNRSPPAA